MAGRAVEILSMWHSEDSVGSARNERAGKEAEEIARTLDWNGRDIVLSIDALPRRSRIVLRVRSVDTPNIDALAKEGNSSNAYCPTPHTSYAVTSMMTGKYMRPLVLQGLGRRLRDVGLGPPPVRLSNGGVLPARGVLHRRGALPKLPRPRLGFEYASVEFAGRCARQRQWTQYLARRPPDAPLFLWVHLFEPHEPTRRTRSTVPGEHRDDRPLRQRRSPPPTTASGRIVRLVRARRPGAVLIVTADHGEEFGEHGGRYHGTTVYEEQVRVPLVIDGPGSVVASGKTASFKRSIFCRRSFPPSGSQGLRAFAGETWVRCSRERAAPTDRSSPTPDSRLPKRTTTRSSPRGRSSCLRTPSRGVRALSSSEDPLERRDISSGSAAQFGELRAALRSLELEFGRYERGGGLALPEALRRGIQGDVEAAVDVAALLDDASVLIRRKAAEVLFELRSQETRSALRRALIHDEDEDVGRWSRLALVRLGDEPPEALESLRKDPIVAWRRRAALARAERGDVTACDDLGSFWADVLPAADQATADGEPPRLQLDLGHIRGSPSRPRPRHAAESLVPALARGLSDVRARPYIADVLGTLGDDRAREPLLGVFASEANVTSRAHEARALLGLGARSWSSPVPSRTFTRDSRSLGVQTGSSCSCRTPPRPWMCRWTVSRCRSGARSRRFGMSTCQRVRGGRSVRRSRRARDRPRHLGGARRTDLQGPPPTTLASRSGS